MKAIQMKWRDKPIKIFTAPNKLSHGRFMRFRSASGKSTKKASFLNKMFRYTYWYMELYNNFYWYFNSILWLLCLPSNQKGSSFIWFWCTFEFGVELKWWRLEFSRFSILKVSIDGILKTLYFMFYFYSFRYLFLYFSGGGKTKYKKTQKSVIKIDFYECFIILFYY
jgi:hypothetical protein